MTMNLLFMPVPEYERFPGTIQGRSLARVAMERYNQWAHWNNIVERKTSYNEYIGLMPEHDQYEYFVEKRPWMDHHALFIDVDGERVYTQQPYVPAKYRDHPAEDYCDAVGVEEWARTRGMKVTASKAESWHYPGGTVLLEFRVDDHRVFAAFVQAHIRTADDGTKIFVDRLEARR
jgi:hypothetical protein